MIISPNGRKPESLVQISSGSESVYLSVFGIEGFIHKVDEDGNSHYAVLTISGRTIPVNVSHVRDLAAAFGHDLPGVPPIEHDEGVVNAS